MREKRGMNAEELRMKRREFSEKLEALRCGELPATQRCYLESLAYELELFTPPTERKKTRPHTEGKCDCCGTTSALRFLKVNDTYNRLVPGMVTWCNACEKATGIQATTTGMIYCHRKNIDEVVTCRDKLSPDVRGVCAVCKASVCYSHSNVLRPVIAARAEIEVDTGIPCDSQFICTRCDHEVRKRYKNCSAPSAGGRQRAARVGESGVARASVSNSAQAAGALMIDQDGFAEDDDVEIASIVSKGVSSSASSRSKRSKTCCNVDNDEEFVPCSRSARKRRASSNLHKESVSSIVSAALVRGAAVAGDDNTESSKVNKKKREMTHCGTQMDAKSDIAAVIPVDEAKLSESGVFDDPLQAAEYALQFSANGMELEEELENPWTESQENAPSSPAQQSSTTTIDGVPSEETSIAVEQWSTANYVGDDEESLNEYFRVEKFEQTETDDMVGIEVDEGLQSSSCEERGELERSQSCCSTGESSLETFMNLLLASGQSLPSV